MFVPWKNFGKKSIITITILIILFITQIILLNRINNINKLESVINIKKWWNKNIILNEIEFPPRLVRDYETSMYKSKNDKVMDFDYLWPRENNYAYVWTVLDSSEFCMVLVALNRLKEFHDSNGNIKGTEGLTKISPDYIIVCFDCDEISPIMYNQWVDQGGLILKVDLNKYSNLLKTRLQKEFLLKYQVSSLSYSWVIQMDPYGIPTHQIPNLFKLTRNKSSLNANVILSAPIDDDDDDDDANYPSARNKRKNYKNLRPKECFVQKTPYVDTRVMLYQPQMSHFRSRIWAYVKLKNIPFNHIINHEFSCNNEIYTLPKNITMGDYEFLHVNGRKPPKLKEASYIFFGHDLIPSNELYFKSFSNPMSKEMRNFLNDWKTDTRQLCDAASLTELNDYVYSTYR